MKRSSSMLVFSMVGAFSLASLSFAQGSFAADSRHDLIRTIAPIITLEPYARKVLGEPFANQYEAAAICNTYGQEFMREYLQTGFSPSDIRARTCGPRNSVDDQPSAMMSEYLRKVNVFVGDEFPEFQGERYDPEKAQEAYFHNCDPLDTTPQGVLALNRNNSHSLNCAALVDLDCGGRRVKGGFHLIKYANPTRYQLRTAAHLIEHHNNALLGVRVEGSSREPSMFDFSKCRIVGSTSSERGIIPGIKLQPVQAPPGVIDEIKERRVHSVFGTVQWRLKDKAWYDIEFTDGPEGQEGRAILEAISLPVLPPELLGAAGSAPSCATGRYGVEGTPVTRCLNPTQLRPVGIVKDLDGRVYTRAPVVNGMSGGVFSVVLTDDSGLKTTYAVGTITGEGAVPCSAALPGTGLSCRIPYSPSHENRGTPY